MTAARTPHCFSRQPRRYSPPSRVQLRDVVATWPFLSCPCVILDMFYLLCLETGIHRWHCILLISSKQKVFLSISAMLRCSGHKLKVLRFLRQHAQLAGAMQRRGERPANYSRIRTENTSTDQRFRVAHLNLNCTECSTMMCMIHAESSCLRWLPTSSLSWTVLRSLYNIKNIIYMNALMT